MWDYVVNHFGIKFDDFWREGSISVVIRKMTTKSSFDLLMDLFFLRCSISTGLFFFFLHYTDCILCSLNYHVLRPWFNGGARGHPVTISPTRWLCETHFIFFQFRSKHAINKVIRRAHTDNHAKTTQVASLGTVVVLLCRKKVAFQLVVR